MSRGVRSRGVGPACLAACLTKVAEDKEYARCVDCGRVERALGARDSKVLPIGSIERLRLHQVQAKHGNNEPDSPGLEFRTSVSTSYCSLFQLLTFSASERQ
jgi:hypothetical protein